MAKGITSKLQKLHKNSKESRSSRSKLAATGRRVPKVDPVDVYEYEPQKGKHLRDKVKLDLDRDEAAPFGRGGGESAIDDEEDSAHLLGRARPRLIGENEDNDRIASEDDEEIDSDGAFADSDAEEFAGFFSEKIIKGMKPQKKRKVQAPSKFVEVNLSEGENGDEIYDRAVANDDGDEEDEEGEDNEGEEEEDGDPEDFIDVLDVLDGRGQPDSGSDAEVPMKKPSHKRTADDAKMGLEGDDDRSRSLSEGKDAMDTESENDGEEEENALSASDVEDSPTALEELGNFISKLEPSHKRKAEDGGVEKTEDDALRIRKKRMLQERTEAGEESIFGGHVSGSSKLKLDDLLAPLSSQSSNLVSLKKAAKTLISTSGPSVLPAPLPLRTQERLDREAAYVQTKEEVDKWNDTIKRIREAEHLSFPLQSQTASKPSNSELTAKFKPTTELESSIDNLLKSAQMRDEDIQHTEALKMNNLTVEEVASRRAELRKMRELMYRAEVKAKRIAKIKSKTYRRIRKKEKANLAADIDDPEDENDEEVRLNREVERARERATLRHKNVGKWAKAMKERHELDVDQRREINEMLDRGERLRRKIRGEAEGDEGGSDLDDHSNADEDAETIKTKAFDELGQLDEESSIRPSVERGKGIFEMKFMKEAMAREESRVDQMRDDFAKEVGLIAADDDEGERGDSPADTAIKRVGGRVVYHPSANLGDHHRHALDSQPSDASSITLRSPDISSISEPQKSVSEQSSVPVVERALPSKKNPWLAHHSDGSSIPHPKNNEIVVGKNSGDIDKASHKLRKVGKKMVEEKEKARDDAVLEISVNDVLTIDAPGLSLSSARRTDTHQEQDHDESSDINSEVEEQEKMVERRKRKTKGPMAFQQRDLVARAFAGDNVVQEFEEIKRREMEEDAPKEIDTSLPGWGSWGGAGTTKRPPRPNLVKKIAGVDPKTRADYGKAHVVISEKRDKKAAKYLVKDLPYPYTSKMQFEKSMETPLGPEWNTRVGFQRATLPKVVRKMGVIIDPLQKVV